MATLLRLDTGRAFFAFNVPRADTALNHRFLSASRRRASVSVTTKPSPFYSTAVYSDSRRSFYSTFASASASASASACFIFVTMAYLVMAYLSMNHH
uniref:Uncharacterized protein n=1 Tax=Noccaea caerulescens TaxID=107243 RepID=A0A1J3HH49_NOCCA